MRRKGRDGVQWVEYDLFSDCKELVQGTFLRHGGVSEDPYRSLNISFEVGDDVERVQKNLDKVCEVLKEESPLKKGLVVVSGRQVHEDRIVEVTTAKAQTIDSCDGLMTTLPGVTLMIKHADCQAAIFYDPVHRALAVGHAGWRGSTLNIFGKIVAAMQERYGTNPEDLLISISPSLGPESSEFIHYKEELPEEFWDFQVKPNYFDFWAISRYQLQQAGVLPSHMELADVDTYAHEEDYYSYRRQKVTGRHPTLAMLV